MLRKKCYITVHGFGTVERNARESQKFQDQTSIKLQAVLNKFDYHEC